MLIILKYMSLAEKNENNYITINDDKILSLIDTDNIVWLYARDITKLLEYIKLYQLKQQPYQE